MTTEPKFVPNEAVEITIGDNLKLKTRLVDCVGYLVNNAIGYLEDDVPRMVKTPWSENEIPFEQAAEIGTRKVIQEHSTIGILVTTDGYSEYTKELARKLEDKYQTAVIPTDCANLNSDDLNDIFARILYEFPIEQININFPKWVDGLDDSHWLKSSLYDEIKTAFNDVRILKQVDLGISRIQKTEIIEKTSLSEITLGNGNVNITIDLKEELFYKVLTEISGVDICNEGDLFSIITELAKTKTEYDKIAYALEEVKQKGYGIVIIFQISIG